MPGTKPSEARNLCGEGSSKCGQEKQFYPEVSGAAMEKDKGAHKSTVCAFTTLMQHTHSQVGHPEHTGKEIVLCPLA